MPAGIAARAALAAPALAVGRAAHDAALNTSDFIAAYLSMECTMIPGRPAAPSMPAFHVQSAYRFAGRQ